MNVAVIDIGSNSIRLSVYRILEGAFTRLYTKKSMAGLAGYTCDGILSEAGVARALDALLHFKELLTLFPPDRVAVFATASLRNISNSEEATSSLEEGTGWPIEVLSGNEEALLGYSGFQYDCPLPAGIMADIGGGSTEVVSFAESVPTNMASMPLGSLKAFNRYVEDVLPTPREVKAIQGAIDKALADADIDTFPHHPELCGIGGTSRAAGKLMARMSSRPTDEHSFSKAQLDTLAALLCGKSRERRDLLLKTCPERLNTVVPGVLILKAVCDHLGCSHIQISSFGVREGYVCQRIL